MMKLAYSESTLKSWNKKNLIEYIRLLQVNLAVREEELRRVAEVNKMINEELSIPHDLQTRINEKLEEMERERPICK